MNREEKIRWFSDRSMVVAYPELIDPLKVQYDVASENTKKYQEYGRDRGSLVHTLDAGIALYHNKKAKKFFVLNHNTKEVLYVMVYETHKIFGHDFAVQSFVWASEDLEAFKIGGFSVTVYVFLKLLMKAADGVAIASDAFHTPDGQRFWKRRVVQALTNSYHVYIIDIPKKLKLEIHTSQEFRKISSQFETWVKSSEGQDRRVIISFNPIKW